MVTELIQEPAVVSGLTAPPFQPRRLTLEEYRTIRDSGVLDDGPKFEFLDGWIVSKMTQGTEHAAVIQIVQNWFIKHLPPEWTLRVQSAVEAAGNEPEPDIAVVKGPDTNYLDHHPVGDEIGLLIEVAETSLVKDRFKTRLYAEAGTPFYWIVNLRDRQIEVFQNPLPKGAGYQDHHIALAGESLEFVVDDVTVKIKVSDILPNIA